MLDFIDDIADFLAAQGYGTVVTNIFVNEMPDDPIDVISVVDLGGTAPAEDVVKRPVFQVMVRKKKANEAQSRMESIYTLLHDKWNIFANFQGRIKADMMPGAYYLDSNNYPVYTLDFDVVATKLP